MQDIEEVKEILENHEKRLSKLEKIFSSKEKPSLLNGESSVRSLLENGFFDHPKKLSDVIKELKKRAKFDKNAKYAAILKKLTREEKLTRKQEGHQWKYKKNE